MHVNFPCRKEASVLLGAVNAGSIIRFVDSSKTARSLAEAQIEPGENLFIVFEDEVKKGPGYVNLVSVDGKNVFRRQDDRLVVVHNVGIMCHQGFTEKALSSLEQGVVIMHGISVGAFEKEKPNAQRKFLYIVTKETPVSASRIPLVSLAGKKIFLDDDRIVLVIDKFELNFELAEQ